MGRIRNVSARFSMPGESERDWDQMLVSNCGANGHGGMAGDEGLPAIPGGWKHDEVPVADRRLRLTRPASPDAFLEDADVLAENARNDFMPYWAYLWPAARAMAGAVAAERWPAGLPALEIGAGIGLVGLAALACGLDVTFSDYRPLPVQLALYNARQNGFARAQGVVLDWTEPLPIRFPLILGCDVVYERRSHAPVLGLVEQMLSPGGVAWFGDGGRQVAAEFVQSARERGFAIELRNEQGHRLSEPHVGRFQLIVLARP